MKNPGNKNNIRLENSTMTITANFAEARLLKKLVEDLAAHRHDTGFSQEKVQPGFQTIETSSLEAFVSVDLNLSLATESFHIPFVTSFLFTCTKGKWLNYNFTWVNSLS